MKKHTSTKTLTAYNQLCDHAHDDKAQLELITGPTIRKGARTLEALRIIPLAGPPFMERIHRNDLDAAAKRLDQRAF